MSNINDDVGPAEKTVEEVYEEEKMGRELFGLEAHGYSPSRKVAAQSMGLLHPFIGEEGEARVKVNGTYPGVLADVIIIGWLCSIPDSGGTWTPAKAFRKPELAMEVAIAWATDQGIVDINSERFKEAFEFFVRTMNAVGESDFTIEVEQVASAGKGSGLDSPVPKI